MAVAAVKARIHHVLHARVRVLRFGPGPGAGRRVPGGPGPRAAADVSESAARRTGQPGPGLGAGFDCTQCAGRWGRARCCGSALGIFNCFNPSLATGCFCIGCRQHCSIKHTGRHMQFRCGLSGACIVTRFSREERACLAPVHAWRRELHSAAKTCTCILLQKCALSRVARRGVPGGSARA
jgi:hypothetical protein